MEKRNIIGKWIQGLDIDYGKEDNLYYQNHRNIKLNRTFEIDNLGKCIFNIGCLGYYIIYINGKRVGNDELNNDWTNYQKCVYFETYDVSDYLCVGSNEIVIELGNGMYNPSPLKLFGKYNLREKLHEVGQPKVICDLWIDNNLVLSSDESWKYNFGNILFNNLYLGETVDYTVQECNLRPVKVINDKRNLVSSFIPKIKRFKRIKPKNLQLYQDGIFVDFGEMISGFIDLTVVAKDSQVVTLQYSEDFKNGEFDFSSSFAGSVGEVIKEMIIDGGMGCPQYAIQTDKIICKDGENHFINKFTYHSFRYVYIQGCKIESIKNIEAIYVHTNLKQVGNVKTDNTYLNNLYDVAMRTKLNNVHSTFEDCARERLGYGGDMVALATSNLYTFDLADFYKKIILDFRFEQTDRGGIPETAPYVGIQSNGTAQGEGPILWQFVYPYLVYKHYQYYGDVSLIKQEYPYLTKQMNYLLEFDLEELVTRCLGDHGSILIAGEFRKPTPDKLLLGYCTVLLFLKYNILLGNMVGKDTKKYQNKYEEIKLLTVEKFKNEDGSFGEGTQSGYAFAIMLELDNSLELTRRFVEKIKKDKYIFNSGIFGMAFTYEVLNKYGYNEVIEKWLLQEDTVSFKSMLSNGNRALAELFIGEHYSLNHAMFASYQQWYYQGLAGIKICDDAVGFNKIELSPYFSKSVDNVECEIETRKGLIKSSWTRNGDYIEWKISLPEHISYKINLENEYKMSQEQNQITICTKG